MPFAILVESIIGRRSKQLAVYTAAIFYAGLLSSITGHEMAAGMASDSMRSSIHLFPSFWMTGLCRLWEAIPEEGALVK